MNSNEHSNEYKQNQSYVVIITHKKFLRMFVSIRKMAKRYSATEVAQEIWEKEPEVESEESEYGKSEDEEFTAEI